MNNDFIFWTFSAAAQSISTFVAFLLTGYALVNNLMERAVERDNTLEDVHAELRKTYHRQLSWLALITCIAIIFSLVIVFINRTNNNIPYWILLIIGGVDISAILGGLVFVVAIIDPEKYRRAAVKELDNESKPNEELSSTDSYFDSFIRLERLVREFTSSKEFDQQFQNSSQYNNSFRQMIEILNKIGIIDHQFLEELLQINKYRNLVFHGQVKQVDESMVIRNKKAYERINRIINTIHISQKLPQHQESINNSIENQSIKNTNIVKNKYYPLKQFLESINQEIKEKTLTFSEIEEILGTTLPRSAYNYREFWSNPSSPKDHPYAQSWLGAGWKVNSVDQINQSVRFTRINNFFA
jgi:hypothetical protein